MKISKDAIKGIIFCGCLVIAWILHKNYCKCPVQKPESELYEIANEKLKKRISDDSIMIVKLKNEKDTIVKEIYRDRTFYKTIYEKIPYSNSIDRINAFDTLLSK